ncbi:CRAL/TRIO domain-containing protein [Linderina pennispora]|uniref:CRAL/TRIO domain-containing protein n=1 Tax=Linderina pennispora TaxID=61395 RepID=A0A1Y1WL93_9FUNG|nr:CRAL/TRIO domain-containing protein [Linderina pennispora]ORX74272.1 CRAL/TRIO domain-containing protein [Linderina pennispora]
MSELSLLDHYKQNRPVTRGRLGHLTASETAKLQQLWQKLICEFDDNKEPLPVRFPLLQQQNDESTDMASLSMNPLVSLSSKDSKPVSTPASGASTPVPLDMSEEAVRQRTETVQQHVRRTQSRDVQPEGFVPLRRRRHWTPDAYVLRFLRARKWDVDAALVMLLKTVEWRVAQAIDEVAYYGEAALHYHTMESGLAFACMTDRLRNPVYVVRVRVNIARNRNILAIRRFLCWQIESAQLLTRQSDGRVTILFDLTGFSKENIDIKLVRTLIMLLTAYYPETLGILILHVNSWVFSGIWQLIQPFIDPAVKEKIVFAKGAADIAQYIDMDELIEEVGGNKPFGYKYVPPQSDENKRMQDMENRRVCEAALEHAVNRYESATREWVETGTAPEGRTQARDAVLKAASSLDPYVRAHTLYHRIGFVQPDSTAEL